MPTNDFHKSSLGCASCSGGETNSIQCWEKKKIQNTTFEGEDELVGEPASNAPHLVNCIGMALRLTEREKRAMLSGSWLLNLLTFLFSPFLIGGGWLCVGGFLGLGDGFFFTWFLLCFIPFSFSR